MTPSFGSSFGLEPSLRIVVLILVATALAACGEGVQPDQREMIYFTAVETDTPEPEVVEDPGPPADPTQLARSKPIVDGFIENHDRLLGEDEIQRQIGRIERLFMGTGEYHKFLEILRDDFEARGADSRVADRYAYALIRLGQRQQARHTLDALLQGRPDDANIRFLDGAFWMQAQPRDQEDLKKALAAWQKALELDPAFRNYDVTAETLRAQVNAIEQQVASAPPSSGEQVPADGAGTDDMREMAEALVKQAAEAEQAKAENAEAETLEAPEAPEQPEQPAEEQEQPTAQDEPAEQQPAEQQPAEAQPAPDRNAPRSMAKEYRILVAKGQIALGQSNYQEAEQNFVKARAMKPNDFAAEFGQLQAQWGLNQNRNDVANRLRRLAEKPNLTAEQRVELGTFLWTKMARKDLARKLYEAAKSADPSMASDVDDLLQQMNP